MREYRKTAWLDPRLQIGSSPLGGEGTFASESIKAGEIVTIWGAEVFTAKEIKQGKAQDRLIIPLYDGWYLAYELYDCNAPDHFLNHSCDPNLWMADEVTLVTRRPIEAGEELTADYALWEIDENWISQWRCQCGSVHCRGTITGKDWRRQELQTKYQDHFLPLINERIRRP
jgi:uncharacterized protein